MRHMRFSLDILNVSSGRWFLFLFRFYSTCPETDFMFTMAYIPFFREDYHRNGVIKP